MTMIYVWLGLMLLFLFLEAVTAPLTCIWCSAGALAALIAVALGAPLWGQILVFLLVSAAVLLLIRPLLRRYVDTKKTPTNVGRLLGQTALVTETIDNLAAAGAVFADGKTWTARSADGSVIDAGTRITIQSIEGVKLIVKKEEPSHANVS